MIVRLSIASSILTIAEKRLVWIAHCHRKGAKHKDVIRCCNREMEKGTAYGRLVKEDMQHYRVKLNTLKSMPPASVGKILKNKRKFGLRPMGRRARKRSDRQQRMDDERKERLQKIKSERRNNQSDE